MLVSNSSLTAVPGDEQVTMLLGLNHYPFTAVREILLCACASFLLLLLLVFVSVSFSNPNLKIGLF